LAYEKETLGFYFSSHPLSGCRKEMEAYASSTVDALATRGNNDEVTIAGIVTEKKEILTRKGDRMAFIKVEDLTGNIEAVVFADLYRKASGILSSDRPLLVTGRLDKDEDEVKLVAEDITLLEDAAAPPARPRDIHIIAAAVALDAAKMTGLRDILLTSPGRSPVMLHLLYPDGGAVVLSLPDGLRVTPVEAMFDRVRGLLPDVEIRVG
ncbi:MAG: DNA polymerase III subunit alpha, partial [Deltaproteobacteria bacterium]|nr:DNA polymerase III subunit alpha [Deltaproteobacteria bacterium]